MYLTLAVCTLALAVVAAARSTWSPCGLSMLSSITPMGERSRGQRWGLTAGAYIVGAVLGGATLGAVLAGGALAIRSAGPPGIALVALGAVAAVGGAAADLGLLGVRFPVLRRQVNELWLDRFRGWVYGAGYGWQIGFGFSTFVMTAAVAVVAVLAAISASPWLAFAVGLTYGAVRGLTVLGNAGVTQASTLVAAHRRYAAWRRPVHLLTVAAQLAVAAALSAVLWRPALAVAAVVAVTLWALARPLGRFRATA
jgi:hypothetical protein